MPKIVTWKKFCSFSDSFGNISDGGVSERYQYGELRLTRLNFWATPLLGQTIYQDFGLQYSNYFGPYFAPLLFVFVVFSVLLSAMQVALAVEVLDSKRWLAFWNVSRWFAVVNIFPSTVPVIGLLSFSIVKLGNAWVFAIRHRPSEQSHTILRQSSHGSLAFETAIPSTFKPHNSCGSVPPVLKLQSFQQRETCPCPSSGRLDQRRDRTTFVLLP